MRLRKREVELLLALFQQMDADSYRPVNRITRQTMDSPLRELRQRIENEYEALAYDAGKNG